MHTPTSLSSELSFKIQAVKGCLIYLTDDQMQSHIFYVNLV